MPVYGKYMPNIVFEFRNAFTKTYEEDYGQKDEYVNPVVFRTCKELTDGMNMDWDGEAEVIFGTFRRSKNGNPVFTITDPKAATRALVRVNWGGAFDSTRGQYSDYEGAKEAEYFHRASSHGGGQGCDYYVLSVDFVLDGPERNVSSILQKMSDTMRGEELEYENTHKAFLIKKQEHEARTAKYDEQVRGLLEEYQKRYLALLPDAELILNTETTATGAKSYDLIRSFKHDYSKRYVLYGVEASEDGIRKMQQAFSDMEKAVEMRKIYEPDMTSLLAMGEYHGIYASEMHLEGCTFEQYVEIINNNLRKAMACGNKYQTYKFNADGCGALRDCLTTYIEEERRKQEEAKAMLLQEKIRLENDKKDKAAREAGYPSDFTYFHRTAGVTGQSIAVVIDASGLRRYNDRIQLRNSNHRHHYNNEEDMIINAEGTQSWDQIRKGEAVFAFTKDDRKSPLVFHDIWMPDALTEAQKEEIIRITQDMVDEYKAELVHYDDYSRTPISAEDTVRICEEHIRTKNRDDREQSSLAYIGQEFPEEKPEILGDKIQGAGDRCLAILAKDGSVMQALTQEQYRDGSPLVCGNAATAILQTGRGAEKFRPDNTNGLGRQAGPDGKLDISRRDTGTQTNMPAGTDLSSKQDPNR